MMMEVGSGVVLFPWVGTKKLETLNLALTARDFEPRAANHVIEVPAATIATMAEVLQEIAGSGVPDGEALADKVAMPFKEKYDQYLWPDLLKKVVMVERLDLVSVPEVARGLINLMQSQVSRRPPA